jgi:hypothetical protein
MRSLTVFAYRVAEAYDGMKGPLARFTSMG